MKIECILQRKGGTVVEMPGKTYHFAPQEDGKHVADVAIEAHVERFLAIPEAYRLLRTAAAEQPATFAPKTEVAPITLPENVALLGADGYPADFTIEGKTYSIDAIKLRAFADSGLTPENWNDLPDDTRALKLDMVLDGIADGEIVVSEAPPATPAPQEAVQQTAAEPTRAELVAQYEAKFGKKPANNIGVETLKAKLAE